SALVYSTFLAGSGGSAADGIAVDGSGNAYVSGRAGANYPTTASVFQPTYGGAGDAFVTKLNADGSALIYSTYLGRSGSDGGGFGDDQYMSCLAVDSSGNAYVTGSTNSTDFPTTAGVFQPAY